MGYRVTTTQRQAPDCIIVGYNEMPFPRFEQAVRRFGVRSAAYRDLQFSFVNIDGEPHTWVDLLNHSERRARLGSGTHNGFADYRCGDIPNLAAVYLTNFLRRRGLTAEYVNLFQFEQDRFRELLQTDPRCVAITTTFYTTNDPATEIVEFVKKHRPGVPVIVGGPLIANHARRYSDAELDFALDGLGADIYVVESQGEYTLYQVIESLRHGNPMTAVPNLILPTHGRFAKEQPRDDALSLVPGHSRYIRTGAVPENNSLDENAIDWSSTLQRSAGATLQTRTARSCAFKCAFCAYPTRAGALTLASLDTIRRELQSMHEYGGIRNLVFVDDTFNVPLPRFKQLCRMLIECGHPFRWYSYFRCNNADEEAIDLMAASGCAGVFLGIESGSQRVLANMSKSVTVEQYRHGIQMLRDHGILTFGSLIAGFPGETQETVDETIEFLHTVGLDYYRIQLWYCEPGTPIDQRRDEFQLQGMGFNWRHRTMDAQEAMSHIDRTFRDVETCWLPQWSFDFWILPYLAGRRIPMDAFKRYMLLTHRLLKLEFEPVRERNEQKILLEQIANVAAEWCKPVASLVSH
jgi:radical SAM PhpK family P-methyltransferase